MVNFAILGVRIRTFDDPTSFTASHSHYCPRDQSVSVVVIKTMICQVDAIKFCYFDQLIRDHDRFYTWKDGHSGQVK